VAKLPNPSIAKRRPPVVHFYGTCWNEQLMLPHFLAHHRRFYDRIFILDDGSTDRSVEILKRESKVSVSRSTRSESESYILFNTHWFNEAWKESRNKADWVVVGNIDEFTYARDLPGYLERCAQKHVTVVPVLGFQMISREPLLPGSQLMRSVQRGAPHESMCRLAIFNPHAIREIRYKPGRHVASPLGEITIPAKDQVLNLHYKFIGLEQTFARIKGQNLRRSGSDLRRGFGSHYGRDWLQYLDVWQAFESRAFDVFEWYRAGAQYPDPVSWRSPASTFPMIEI
jgi:hypothetical protein